MMATGDSDLIKLYSQRILALAADIPHHGRLEKPSVTIIKRSPLCGSTVTVDLVLKDGRVAGFGQDVKACALGQASASVLGKHAIGRTRDEIEALRDQLKAMLAGSTDVPADPFGEYEVLLPAQDYRNRHASIMLAPEATLTAFDEALATT